MYSEESDDFSFDTSEEDSDSVSDTNSVVQKSEVYKKYQIFRHLLYLNTWHVQDLHFLV